MFAFAITTAFLEFKPIKNWTIFFFADDNILKWTLLFITFILTLLWLQRSLQLYKEQKKSIHLLIPIVGGVVCFAVVTHTIWQNSIAKRKSLYEAYNYDIGTDGGLKFDFKEGGYLLGEKIDRFSTTYYSGTFRQNDDTLLIDIPLDFPLGKQAYIKNDTLMAFKDDTTKFYFYKKN